MHEHWKSSIFVYLGDDVRTLTLGAEREETLDDNTRISQTRYLKAWGSWNHCERMRTDVILAAER
jgi:hypothetical protein